MALGHLILSIIMIVIGFMFFQYSRTAAEVRQRQSSTVYGKIGFKNVAKVEGSEGMKETYNACYKIAGAVLTVLGVIILIANILMIINNV
jgi:hypothetical protein